MALTTLMHERLAVGGGQGGGLDVPQLMALARELELEDGPAIKNAAVREKIADWYVRSAGLKYTTYRTMTALSKGQQPGPEASIAKIVVAPKLQDLSRLRHRTRRRSGRAQGARCADEWDVPDGMDERAGPSHRRWDGRDSEKHYCRTGSRLASGRAC